VITFRPLKRSPEDYAWIKQFIQCVVTDDMRGIVAEKDGQVVAMYVFNNWTENSVQCHQAVHDPFVFKHGLHKETAKYVYGEAGRKIMIGLTPSDNPEAIKLNKHYGFTEAYRMKDAVKDGVDYVVMTMHRDDCPYYEQEQDRVPESRSAA